MCPSSPGVGKVRSTGKLMQATGRHSPHWCLLYGTKTNTERSPAQLNLMDRRTLLKLRDSTVSNTCCIQCTVFIRAELFNRGRMCLSAGSGIDKHIISVTLVGVLIFGAFCFFKVKKFRWVKQQVHVKTHTHTDWSTVWREQYNAVFCLRRCLWADDSFCAVIWSFIYEPHTTCVVPVSE